MRNLLFVSNSFDDYILANISDLCFDISIENIILLKEYHNCNEFKRRSVILCNTLDEAIQKADVIVYLSDEFQNENLRINIYKLASNYGKKVFEIKNPWQETHLEMESRSFEDYRNKVVILILAFETRLLTLGEIVINKVMRSLNADFKQYYSLPTEKLISGLAGIIDNNMFEHASDSNIVIETMKLKNASCANIENYELYQKMLSIKPDCVILCTNQEYTHDMNDEFDNLLKYVGRTKLNFILQSDYIYLRECNRYVFLDNPLDQQIDNLINIQDARLINRIKDDILRRIACPVDIHVIG